MDSQQHSSTSGGGVRGSVFIVSIKLHDSNADLPFHLIPHVSGPSPSLGSLHPNESIEMSHPSELLWEMELIMPLHERLEFKFLLKDLENTNIWIAEDESSCILRNAHEKADSISHARFQLPDTKESIDLLSECHIECISPSSLATLWRAYKEDMRSSASVVCAHSNYQELNILGLNGAYSDENLLEAVELPETAKKTMLPRQRSVSVQDLVVLGSEAELSMGIPSTNDFNGISEIKTIDSDVSLCSMEGVAETSLNHDSAMTGKDVLEMLPSPVHLITDQKFASKERRRLAIIMVGLPARGKTFTAVKLTRYLRWLGHLTKHFNVGKYRRNVLGHNQKADFFRGDNPEGLDARNEVALLAMKDMLAWMQGAGQIGIFDATNSTQERRNMLLKMCEEKCKVIFLEIICNDQAVIDRNIGLKIQQSPDYVDMPDIEEASKDFKTRLANYEKVYEPVAEGSYIKMINTVGGEGGQVQINNISGYLPGRILFFLVNTHTNPRPIFLTRPGESFGTIHCHVGGDQKLSETGKKYARVLADFMNERLKSEETASVWTSTLQRTTDTAAHLIAFPKVQWRALDDINAGICDGMTYEEIKSKFPEEYEARRSDKLRYRYPRGESYLDVIQRLEPVIIELERQHSPVLIVTHQALLRSLYGYFADNPIEQIPYIDIPLHTVIEIQMGAAGIEEKRYKLL